MTLAGQVHFQEVTQTYSSRNGPVHALGPVHLQIEQGEFVCLVGPSGCGKTTLLRMLAGFLKPSAGTVQMEGEVIQKPGRGRGVVFQQPTLYPWLNVQQNVELGLRFRRLPASERSRIAKHFLQLVGLQDFARHAPYELSGGMQQRCAIARTLANDPDLILMDEPFGALDALTRENLQEELKKIHQATSKTVLLVTHSVEEAVFLGSRVVVLSPRPGRIVLDLQIELPQDSKNVRLTPEFAALRARISNAIGQHA